jgi:hypothetical protein
MSKSEAHRQLISGGQAACIDDCSRCKLPGKEITYQVADSGCVVTVRDTGVASLAPRTRIGETDSSSGGRRVLLCRQVIQLAPNCPYATMPFLSRPIVHASLTLLSLTNTQSLSVFSWPVDQSSESLSAPPNDLPQDAGSIPTACVR